MSREPEPDIDRSAELLERWQRNDDRDALDDLLRIETALLKIRVRGQGARPGAADVSGSDVVQETVMRTLRVGSPPKFDNPRALRAYLWTAASRMLAERLRRRDSDFTQLDASASRAVDAGLATTGGLGEVDRRDQSVVLSTLRQLLEPGEQQILDLVFTRELDYEAAAAELGITADAARMRCARAKQRLLQKLGDWTELIG